MKTTANQFQQSDLERERESWFHLNSAKVSEHKTFVSKFSHEGLTCRAVIRHRNRPHWLSGQSLGFIPVVLQIKDPIPLCNHVSLYFLKQICQITGQFIASSFKKIWCSLRLLKQSIDFEIITKIKTHGSS